MLEEQPMARYQKGDHVKIEVTNEQSRDSEWMWLLVDHSDDEQQLVFGQLDSDPVVATDMNRDQALAVRSQQVRDHRKLSAFEAQWSAVFRFGKRNGRGEIMTKIASATGKSCYDACRDLY
jgi:hypothetical protein